MKICGIDIPITDSDIDEIEQILGNVSFDSERRDIIKRLDTFDVQAYPGTGKTTLLVAKLAILAKKWPFTHKGICVLSHTNVAREEIESRLGNTELGRKLLSYPHFIGTIHSFADTFIGIPFLRSNNKPVVMIDTESTLERRYNLLSPGSQSYFARKHLSSNNCESTAYPIQIDIKCAETTPTYHSVFSVVESSINRGFYTFNEMLLISKHALSVIPSMPGIIQRRFPVLMIDEAQDTSELQWEIIMLAFPDKQNTLVERFGDANQAIYHSYQASISSSQYPQGEVLSVNGSLRFGKEIAALADPLSTDFSGMEGKSTQFSSSSNHTIILFEKSKASEVFSVFGELVLETFSDTELVRYSSFGVHAIGMVHNKDKTGVSEPSYPASLCDYYNSYMPSLAKKSGNPSFVIDYFRRKESSQSLSEAIGWITKGIRFYIDNSTLKRISYRKSDWYSLLREIDSEQQLAFRKDFQRLLSLNCSTETEWEQSAKELMSFCEKWFDAELQNPRPIMWTDGEPELEDKPSSNTIRYIGKSGRTADILLGSIHSEKGRTHLATLVLDTFWYDRNIISILPWVTGNKKQGRIGERDLKRLRCHYVAFTRPRGLLCVAIPSNTISAETIDSLQKHGWKIKMIE